MLHNLLWSFKSIRQSMAYLMVSFLNYKHMVYLGIFYSGLKVTKDIDLKKLCIRPFIVKMGYICWCTPKFCFRTFTCLIYVDNVAETILSICRLFADNNMIHFSNLRMAYMILNIKSIHLKLKLFIFQGRLVLLHQSYFSKAISWQLIAM